MEWKPPEHQQPRDDVDRLGNFLSGMETAPASGQRIRQDSLGNFLSGMETGAVPCAPPPIFLPWKLP